MKGFIMAQEYRLTGFSINSELKEMINQLLEQDKRSTRSYHHRKAIETFYNSNNQEVFPALLIKSRHPGYVRRDEREQVYLDDDMERMLSELAAKNNCKPSTVFFHAMLVYVANLL